MSQPLRYPNEDDDVLTAPVRAPSPVTTLPRLITAKEHAFAAYIQVPNFVLTIPEHLVPARAKLLYGVLWGYGGMPRGAIPGVARLAKRLGVSKRTVQRDLRDLVGAGLILRKTRIVATNHYTFPARGPWHEAVVTLARSRKAR